MKILVPAILAAIFVVPGASAAEVEMTVPADVIGQIGIDQISTLFIQGSAASQVELHSTEVTAWERSGHTTSFQNGLVAGNPGTVAAPEQESFNLKDATGALTSRGPWGIAILDGNANLTADGHAIIHDAIVDGGEVETIPRAYKQEPVIAATETLLAPPRGVVLLADGVTELQWSGSARVVLFGFTGSVVGDDESHELWSGFHADESVPGTADRVMAYTHAMLDLGGGTLKVSTSQARAAATGAGIDLDVDGRLIAVLAHGTGDYVEGTYDTEGSFALRDLAATRSNGVTTNLALGNATLLIDDVPVGPQSGSIAVVAAGIGIVAALALIIKTTPLLTPLLTRLPPEKALENKNRRTLHEYIKEHPGATFREVLRGADMAAGTARHHLTVLARSEVIVEHGHRSTLRFFENHGKFDGTWESVVLLREQELAKVHGWLERHPDAIQKEVLAHAEGSWGWSRSTTQHRLARLIDGGLVAFRQAGRRKYYRAVDPSEARPVEGFKASWT